MIELMGKLKLRETDLQPVRSREAVCCFLGAGFSRACNESYPTSIGFLEYDLERGNATSPELALYDSAPGSSYTFGLLRRLQDRYGDLRELSLEDVMTELHVRAFGLRCAWDHATPRTGFENSVGSFRRDYHALLYYVAERLFSIDGTDRDPHGRATKFFDLLQPQDSVVTFNYDTVAERHLPRHETGGDDYRVRHMDGYIGTPGTGLGVSRPKALDTYKRGSPGILAKLHGSIDWYTCSNLDCPNHPYISVGWLTRDKSDITAGGARCTACGSGTETVIVPPTLHKPFDRFPKLRLMWLQAYNSLCDAQRWTFIGVSLAPTDFHLSALLRSCSRDSSYFKGKPPSGQLCVVNKDYGAARDVAERLSRSVAPAVRRCLDDGTLAISIFGSLDEYLEAVENVDKNREPLVVEK